MVAAAQLLGAAAGLLADRALGEPPDRVHPVAGFGRLMQRIEGQVYADRRAAGIGYAAAGAAVGMLAGRVLARTSVGVALASAGRMLRSEALAVHQLLDDEEIVGARERVASLVGRDTSELDASGVSAAVIESVAENMVDAVVAPALWGSAAGAAGALAYRALNTMDAMVGHHSERYEHFGWCSARLDDVAGYVPARATAMLVCAVAPSRANDVLAAVRRDASRPGSTATRSTN